MTATTLKLIFSRTSGHCHFCGDKLIFSRRGIKKDEPEKGAWEVDHVIQKHKGGKNASENYLLHVSAAIASVGTVRARTLGKYCSWA